MSKNAHESDSSVAEGGLSKITSIEAIAGYKINMFIHLVEKTVIRKSDRLPQTKFNLL